MIKNQCLIFNDIHKKGNEENVCDWITTWVNKNGKKIYYLKNEKEEILAFAILHKMDFDPLKRYNKPYIFDLVYTLEKYRRNSYALKILEKLKDNKEELSALCSNDASVNLFKKEYYYFQGMHNHCEFFRSIE